MVRVPTKVVCTLAGIAVILVCSIPSFAQQASEIPLVDAELGPCSANFQVTDEAGKPVSGANIHADIPAHIFQDGHLIWKTDNVEVVTNSEGKARIIRLPRYPQKGVTGADGRSRSVMESMIPRTVVFHITHDQMEQSLKFEPVVGNCEGDFRVALSKRESATSEVKQ